MPNHILIVDDEPGILDALSGILQDESYEVSVAKGGQEALKVIKADPPPDLVLLDIWMPDLDGIETLQRAMEAHPRLLVIMMSGHGSIESAVKAIKLGAYDFIEKPLSLDKVTLLVRHALHERRLELENRALKERAVRRFKLVGDSVVMFELRRQIGTAGPAPSRVLITGENGTGKELVARGVHLESPRADKPFIEVNCAAIPETLIESELFGHEKGAFTGASAMRRGQFEVADGGTLLLGEGGAMSLAPQAKVLRDLQAQGFQRGGGAKPSNGGVRAVIVPRGPVREGAAGAQLAPGPGEIPPPQIPSAFDYASLRDARAAFEREYIGRKLREHGWNVSKTADDLKVERSHLHRKIKLLNIEVRPES